MNLNHELIGRLRSHAPVLEREGYPNAARYMLDAAAALVEAGDESAFQRTVRDVDLLRRENSRLQLEIDKLRK